MEINNQGDNQEKKTPDANAPGEQNKSTDETEFEKLKKETQVEIDALKARVLEKENQATQLTIELQTLRKELRTPLLSEKKVEEKKTDDNDFNEDDIDSKVDQKLAEKEKENYKKIVNRCFEKFQQQVEFDAEIDLKFREKANKTHLGDSEDEIMETFQILFNGISTSLNRQQKKEDKKDEHLSVGDGGNEEVNKPKKTGQEWLAKKLNRFEQAAANNFTGGEKAYRQKMQELADKKTS